MDKRSAILNCDTVDKLNTVIDTGLNQDEMQLALNQLVNITAAECYDFEDQLHHQAGGQQHQRDDVNLNRKRSYADTETNNESALEKESREDVGGKVPRPLPSLSPTPSHASEDLPNDFKEASHFYEILGVQERKSQKFKASCLDYKVKFRNVDDIFAIDALPLISNVFEDLIHRLTDGLERRSMVRMIIQNNQLGRPISLPFMTKDDLTVDRILTKIELVLQSHKTLTLDEKFTLDFMYVELPEGSRPRQKLYKSWDKKKKECYHIVEIKNPHDRLCLGRAIVTAIAKQETGPRSYVWQNIRRSGYRQFERARDLYDKAGVPYSPGGLQELDAFQKVVTDYQICVVSKEQFNNFIYKGPPKAKSIYLLYENNHFDVITSMESFTNRVYYCDTCKVGYNTRREHPCEITCKICYNGNCQVPEDTIDWVHCSDCNRNFKNMQCFMNHKTKGSGVRGWNTICDQYCRCRECGQFINKEMYRGTIHRCTETFCRTCNGFYPIGHRCYMKPAAVKTDSEELKGPHKYIFFDFECMQETGIHKPNLCVAQKVCHYCQDKPIESGCIYCGCDKQKVFKGSTCVEDFMVWALGEKRNRNATLLAHNMSGYDGYLILQWLYDNCVLPEVIMNGGKIMTMKIPGARFIDTLNFMQMSLAKLPRAFDEKEISKGFFPHLFNTEGNQQYVGELPDREFFDPEGMASSTKEEFETWYREEKDRNKDWNLQKELLKYCINDVEVLRKCSMKFRSIFMEISRRAAEDTDELEEDKGIDVFEECITLASACNLLFRRNYLQPDTIPIIHPCGIKPNQNFSPESIRWLSYVAMEHGLDIRHAMNGGEARIKGRITVDGICLNTKQIFEFYGCKVHGCPCQDEDTIHSSDILYGVPAAERYRRTIERRNFIQRLCPDYQIVEIWQHEWKDMWKSLPEDVKQQLKVPAHLDPLNPRESLYGGKTECTKLFYEVQGQEKIRYFDFTSLYPWVNKYCPYPLGFMKVIINNFDSDIGNYFGLIRCTLLPSRYLFHPVLPTRCHGKLMFGLCHTCMEEQCQSDCPHTDDERKIKGTWCTLEVHKAIEVGYKLLDTEIVWHFPEQAVYDKVSKSGGLFTEYIDTFLKLKQQASGWPAWCKTEEDRDYVMEYYENEGIQLEKDRIETNPGLRSLSKLCLNSLWGKFAQRSNLNQTVLLTDPADVYKFLKEETITVKDIRIINNESVELTYCMEEENVEVNPNTNVVLASFTTCHARLRLYSLIEKLGEAAYYMDTDSVVFLTRDNNDEPLKTGDYLGELTDECPEGSHITTFASSGCKSYTYKTNTGDVHVKCKGITLNVRNSNVINHDTMLRLVKDFKRGEDQEKVRVVEPRKIVRNLKTKDLESRLCTKEYRVVFDKRRIVGNYCTLPYGYGLFKE